MKADAVKRVAQGLQLLRSCQMDVRFHGESMVPFLCDGDRVIVEAVDWDDIRAGDLIAYRLEDKFPTRRVVRKSRTSLLLWCDNWPDLRFRISRAQVLGRVVARERDGTRVHQSDAEWRAATDRGFAIFRRWRVRRAVKRMRIAAGRLLALCRARAVTGR
jgi:Peptidase S24-like